MTYGKPTTLSAVLAALEARAADALSVDPAFVWTSLDVGESDRTGVNADVCCVLTLPRGRIDQSHVAGGGDDLLSVDLTLTVELWVRVDLDEPFKDVQALRNATVGVLKYWRLLLAADAGLQLYSPTATGGNQSILREPMRLVDFDLAPRKAAAGWAKVVSRWDVKYVEDTTS